jgi:hypothetical protein
LSLDPVIPANVSGSYVGANRKMAWALFSFCCCCTDWTEIFLTSRTRHALR